MKTCKKCDNSFPATSEYFRRNPLLLDGLESRCRQCANARERELRAAKRPPKDVLPEGQKRCTACKQVFPMTTDYFYSHKGMKCGLSPQCRPCRLKAQMVSYRKRKPKVIVLPVLNSTKVCGKCNHRFLATPEYFPKHPNGKQKLNSLCHSCTKATWARRYHSRQDKGMCIRCGKLPATLGYTRCPGCLREHKETASVAHRKRLQEGICIACHIKPATDGLSQCTECREIRKQYGAKKLAHRRANGLCHRCGQIPKIDGYSYCMGCVIKNNQEYKKIKSEIFAAYGDKCACCGETEPLFLTIDHVNNDGAQDRTLNRSRFYYRIKREGFPDRYQLLCYNCNCSKGHFGYCPHTLIED